MSCILLFCLLVQNVGTILETSNWIYRQVGPTSPPLTTHLSIFHLSISLSYTSLSLYLYISLSSISLSLYLLSSIFHHPISLCAYIEKAPPIPRLIICICFRCHTYIFHYRGSASPLQPPCLHAPLHQPLLTFFSFRSLPSVGSAPSHSSPVCRHHLRCHRPRAVHRETSVQAQFSVQAHKGNDRSRGDRDVNATRQARWQMGMAVELLSGVG